MLILKLIVITCGLLIIWHASNLIIEKFIKLPTHNDTDIIKPYKVKEGKIIGKCENIIIYCLVLADAFTGLALIFAAKNLVRQEQIKRHSEIFLVGTMLNFTISLVISIAVKFLLTLIEQS